MLEDGIGFNVFGFWFVVLNWGVGILLVLVVWYIGVDIGFERKEIYFWFFYFCVVFCRGGNDKKVVICLVKNILVCGGIYWW